MCENDHCFAKWNISRIILPFFTVPAKPLESCCWLSSRPKRGHVLWQNSSVVRAECHVGEQALPAGRNLSQELQGQGAEVRGTVSLVQLSWLEVQVISIPLAKKGIQDSA